MHNNRSKRIFFIELFIVACVLVLLLVWKIPQFLGSQETARLYKNEEELKKILAETMNADNKYRKILFRDTFKDTPNVPGTHSLYPESILDYFPDSSFDFAEGDKPYSVYLGLDYAPDTDQLTIGHDFPIGFFIIVNDDNKQSPLSYFQMVSVDSTFGYLEPKPEKYFAVSNGISSVGMIYVDSLGRSWRDPQ